jgi:hypothetical protein
MHTISLPPYHAVWLVWDVTTVRNWLSRRTRSSSSSLSFLNPCPVQTAGPRISISSNLYPWHLSLQKEERLPSNISEWTWKYILSPCEWEMTSERSNSERTVREMTSEKETRLEWEWDEMKSLNLNGFWYTCITNLGEHFWESICSEKLVKNTTTFNILFYPSLTHSNHSRN